MERFVREQNLLRYLELYERESDGDGRARIAALLIEEVRQWDDRREFSSKCDGLISAARMRIIRQEARLSALQEDGHDDQLEWEALDGLRHSLMLLLRLRSELFGKGDA